MTGVLQIFTVPVGILYHFMAYILQLFFLTGSHTFPYYLTYQVVFLHIHRCSTPYPCLLWVLWMSTDLLNHILGTCFFIQPPIYCMLSCVVLLLYVSRADLSHNVLESHYFPYLQTCHLVLWYLLVPLYVTRPFTSYHLSLYLLTHLQACYPPYFGIQLFSYTSTEPVRFTPFSGMLSSSHCHRIHYRKQPAIESGHNLDSFPLKSFVIRLLVVDLQMVTRRKYQNLDENFTCYVFPCVN